MKYNVVYVVLNQGEVMFVSVEKEEAEGFASEQNFRARQAVLDEWGNDDPTEKDIAEADVQAGFDGDYYEVKKVNIGGKTEDDIVELMDGTEIAVSDILANLE